MRVSNCIIPRIIPPAEVCKFGKRFDCTDMTGVAPPGRKYGACAFPNEPVIQYYWEPWCSERDKWSQH